jgi:hypothetical protein
MLTHRVDLFDSTNGHFTEDVLAVVRRETSGLEIGQNSWTKGCRKFLAAVQRLTSERRRSQIAYLVEKPAE